MSRHFLALVLLALLPLGARAQASPPASPDPVLLPGDVIRIAIWREEDLSGEFVVSETGTVVLPLLGELAVGRIPLPTLRDTLLTRYQHQLRNPSIQITPLRRITVMGEVLEPGLKVVDPTMSLAQAIALAGGASPSGDLRRIRIIRGGVVLRDQVSSDATLSAIDVRSGDQIIVDRRPWASQNSMTILSTAASLLLLTLSLLVR